MTSPAELIVTTSWDDGHRLDPRLAELLDRYRVPGTFYIAPRNIEFDPADRLPAAGIRELATRHEIGGHTLTHPRLPLIADRAAREDIRAGKIELEDMIGDAIESFCYPRGEYDERHTAMVRDCGFALARTVRRHTLNPGKPFESGTTVNAYAHRVDGLVALRMARFRPRATSRLFRHWDDLAKAWFDTFLEQGGVFHLWGHSWEVDARGDWERLERVLDYIGNRPGVRYVTNGELAGAGV
ncbi:polysaccharide deacetylase family protein [Paractinoplanes durhamensis]|uniref:Endo-1,4-beta-xylanase n=1 Tax=Paractinoplanes durhamensis TaxID=113563 RepID=A0ABQ3Z9X4_9ACTN|nr:polysaccharide deacetylase family protein [Actinoplanes durhamensis]GIE06632.1 endo-1,4-beta-xylanase [Actinoplanes durhamensis]